MQVTRPEGSFRYDLTSGQQFIIIHQVAIVLLQSESPDGHTGIIQQQPCQK